MQTRASADTTGCLLFSYSNILLANDKAILKCISGQLTIYASDRTGFILTIMQTDFTRIARKQPAFSPNVSDPTLLLSILQER